MDAVQRAFYRLQFRNAFLEQKGTAFQDWFARLASFALGSDFERIRPYGAQGDFKADGRTRSDRTIYQCYAPETLKQDRLLAKMEADLAGAEEHWRGWMKRWVFVHNDTRGLPATVRQGQDQLRSRYQRITIEGWGEAELTSLAERMDLTGWESMFGVVPSRRDEEAVTPEHVASVVADLQRAEPSPGEEPVRPPSADKIVKNELSGAVRGLLWTGKAKDGLVKGYFDKHQRPNLGEQIAEAFRRRYRQLRETEHSPDDIFFGLQRYVGFDGSPKRQMAALGVLSYLFDRCDIFEDPDDSL